MPLKNGQKANMECLSNDKLFVALPLWKSEYFLHYFIFLEKVKQESILLQF